jgi:hypothetical protein
MDIKELGYEGAGWIHLAEDKDQWRALVNTVMTFRFSKELNYYYPLKDYAPWSQLLVV